MVQMIVGKQQVDCVVFVQDMGVVPDVGKACSRIKDEKLPLVFYHDTARLIGSGNPAGSTQNIYVHQSDSPP